MAKKELAFEASVDIGNGAKSIRTLKEEYKAAQQELNGLEVGTKAYVAQLEKLGQIKDNIGDLNAEIAAFNPQGKVQAFSNVVGGIASGFSAAQAAMALFGAEGEDLQKTLVKVQAGMAFAEGIKGLAGLKDGFVVLGNVLKANPILLIASIIISIGTALFALKDKIKIIGVYFELLGDVIGTVVQAGKDFLDWVGLSNFAAEEQAEAIVSSAKKQQEAVTKRYDNEIAMAKAAGKNTVELEKLKQQAIIDSADIQIKAITDLVRVNGEVTEEQINQLNELKKQRQDAELEQKVIAAKAKKEEEDKLKDLAKKAEEAAERQRDFNIKRAEETQKLANQIRQIEISLIEDVEQRRIQQLTFEAELRKQEINNSKADADVKAAAVLEVEKQLQSNITNVQKEELDKRQKQSETANAKRFADSELEVQKIMEQQVVRAELYQLQNQNDLESQLAYLEAKKNQELANTELTEVEKTLITERYEKERTALKVANFQQQLQLTQQAIAATQALTDLAFAHQLRQAAGNAKKEKEIKKKQFQVNKAFSVAQIILNTIMGITQAISSSPPPLSWVLAGINSAMGTAATIKALTTKFDDGGASGGMGGIAMGGNIGAAGGGVNVAPPSTNSTLLNADGSIKKQQGMSQPTVKAIVTETDITQTQKRVNSIEETSKIK